MGYCTGLLMALVALGMTGGFCYIVMDYLWLAGSPKSHAKHEKARLRRKAEAEQPRLDRQIANLEKHGYGPGVIRECWTRKEVQRIKLAEDKIGPDGWKYDKEIEDRLVA